MRSCAAAAVLALTAGCTASGATEPVASAPPSPQTVPAPPADSGWRASAVQAMDRVRAEPAVDQTCRQVLRSSTGGSRLRVRLSNAGATTPLVLASATVGLRSVGPALRPASVVPLQVAGMSTVVVPPGGEVLSDPVDLPVRAGDDVAVSLALRGTAQLAEHTVGVATGFCTPRGSGDRTAQATAAGFAPSGREGLVVEALEVLAGDDAPAGVVAVGDSLTDPRLAPDAYVRWTDEVVRRLGGRVPVANAAIGGNRVLLPGGYGPTLVERFRHDVLDRPGTGTVVLLAGTNDISAGATAAQLTARLADLCTQARRDGLRVVLLSIPPAHRRPPAQEQVRRAVDDWVRTSGVADDVVDADALLRDPRQPRRLLPAYDSGDGLHLSAAGHAALGAAVSRVLEAEQPAAAPRLVGEGE